MTMSRPFSNSRFPLGPFMPTVASAILGMVFVLRIDIFIFDPLIPFDLNLLSLKYPGLPISLPSVLHLCLCLGPYSLSRFYMKRI